MLKQAARRHQSGESSISFHVFPSCSFSNLCLFFILCMVSQAAKTLARSPLPLSFSGNVNVLLTHCSQLLGQPQSSALV